MLEILYPKQKSLDSYVESVFTLLMNIIEEDMNILNDEMTTLVDIQRLKIIPQYILEYFNDMNSRKISQVKRQLLFMYNNLLMDIIRTISEDTTIKLYME